MYCTNSFHMCLRLMVKNQKAFLLIAHINTLLALVSTLTQGNWHSAQHVISALASQKPHRLTACFASNNTAGRIRHEDEALVFWCTENFKRCFQKYSEKVIKQTCNHKCRGNSTLMHRGWHVWWVSVDNAAVTVALFSLKKVAALSRARSLPFSSMKDWHDWKMRHQTKVSRTKRHQSSIIPHTNKMQLCHSLSLGLHKIKVQMNSAHLYCRAQKLSNQMYCIAEYVYWRQDTVLNQLEMLESSERTMIGYI